jgi:predicted esterase
LTVKQYVQTIKSQIDQRELETDFPAAQLLQLGEQLVADPSQASELWRKQGKESVWLTLSHNRRSLPVRVRIPEKDRTHPDASPADAVAERRPILFAFHGAGGSENMFFETYGAGRLVELAAARGFIVVAPRHPLLGMPLNYRQMIDVLDRFFPIDHERVFLLGHSMGAGEVVRQVSLHSTPPRAAIALGGGGSAKNTPAVAATSWLVAAGELDFGRSGAKSLVKQLERVGSRVDYREYPNVEHMVIVQAALDDAFSFIDQQ